MNKWVDRLQNSTFRQIVYLWIAIGIGFAGIYYFLNYTPENTMLFMGKPLDHNFSDFITMLYFSFVTLTSTGYGDVIPLGLSRIISVIEIFFGLVVFGFLISKLVSARQEKIIEELYDISFEDKVSRLRSQLYIYRVNISRIIDRITNTRFVKRSDMVSLESNLEGMKGSISRIKMFLESENKKSISKVDDITLNLLFNSFSLSVSRMIEIFTLLDSKKYQWKKKSVTDHVSSCISSIRETQALFEKKKIKDEVKNLMKTLDDSMKQLEEIIKQT